ncbi:MAG TPA: circularly permuted type 2 ATP-grasp protein, partial [Polyangiaceae bacterium]|nr:circularly permuted type 2 ATP-grasp protein [Polyangiaceae bacterium]
MSVPANLFGYLRDYQPEPGRYDELLDARARIRPHWQGLMERLTKADLRQSTQRCLQLTRRLIAENGVTYNVYADAQGADRPWTLDPLPLVLTATEWRDIERGVEQRARLLNALLADLYGAQRLIAEGLVPPQIPFGHPNFLWPCHGVVPRESLWLRLYAADLARAPDGRWWVVADRTQAPSGAGYALENRQIMEQVLPHAIRELDVRRVRGFFAELREQLLARGGSDEGGLAVILTPGPLNETYFEQAYLAHQLGWPLVEGADLTVRRDTVFLKTLAGLRRVHTIIRRVDDDWCDPLELRSSSALGVPGLIGAVRAGRVTLANALGAGVLESPAWFGFMPAIAERLLGEPLHLPSVASWWCGERPALEHVVRHFERLVIKPTYPNQRLEPLLGAALDGRARAQLIAHLRAQPHAYVAQEPAVLSQAPSLRADTTAAIEARSLSLRVFALLGPQGCVILPGGLARVAATGGAPDVVSHQGGGGSKDVWVQPDSAAVDAHDPSVRPFAVLVRHEELPSRLVENLYWFGRYSSRCEDKARLLRATLAARIDPEVYETAVGICRELGAAAADADPSTALRQDLNPHGIIADARHLVWCASQIRSRLSATYWRTIAELQRQLHDSGRVRADPRKALEGLLLSLAAFAGLALDDMRQDQGWRLLSIGRRIERLQFCSRLLALYLASAPATQQAHVEWVLTACDSLRVYRPRYAVAPRLGPMLDLLIRDGEHPRSLSFQWRALTQDLAALRPHGVADQAGLGEALPNLGEADLVALEGPEALSRLALSRSLHSQCEAAEQLSDRLSMRYFSHTRLDSHA